MVYILHIAVEFLAVAIFSVGLYEAIKKIVDKHKDNDSK